MIPYKLAKELKDAGFPQEGIREPYCMECGDWKKVKCFNEKHPTRFLVVPTLSELIDAIDYKKNWLVMTYVKGAYWNASIINRKKLIEGQGFTLDSAVAKLWLKLNKNEPKLPKN